MQIILVRHGATDWNLQHRCQGSSDRDLSDVGLRQAEEIAAQEGGRGWQRRAAAARQWPERFRTQRYARRGQVSFAWRRKRGNFGCPFFFGYGPKAGNAKDAKEKGKDAKEGRYEACDG